jgi:phosphate transport system substrate-binding protein
MLPNERLPGPTSSQTFAAGLWRERPVRRWLLAACLIGPLLLTACERPPAGSSGGNGSPSANQPATSTLAGAINIEGSSTVEPIAIRAREMFSAVHPSVNISVSGQGTSNGYSALALRECDICDASRPMKASELEVLRKNSVGFIELPVAFDGLSIVVNKDNDFVQQLTIDQLKRIFREDLAATTWQDVDPAWPAEKIAVYAAGIKSGTHDYFVEVIGKEDKKGLRSDEQTTLSEDDKQLVLGVRGDKYAIGFFGYAYYQANTDQVRAVPIVNPESGKAVMPTRETIESGEYAPFSRPLFMLVNADAIDRTEVREFVDYLLENIGRITPEAGYVQLPEAITEIAKQHVADKVLGTHFLTVEGESREGKLGEQYTAENALR